ncbi:MAG: hypothetical protein GY841_01135 [FCB group bacterium]|nr:hypothetical protein [FCB group bacterium]
MFIQDRGWVEAGETMEFVTRSGPHMVLFKERDGLRQVLGTVRIKTLDTLYDGSDEQYRLYMQPYFTDNLFRRGAYCAFSRAGMADELYQFLARRTSKKKMEWIAAAGGRYAPEYAFDYAASLSRMVSFMQFLPTRLPYILTLAAHAARAARKLGAEFITTTLETDLVWDTMYAIEGFCNSLRQTDERLFCLIAQSDRLLNRQTGSTHKTMTWLIDARLAEEMAFYLKTRSLHMKTVRYGRAGHLRRANSAV